MDKNKPLRWGISKLGFAKLTRGASGVTFAAPVPMPGARQLTMNPEGGSEDFHADNGVYFTTTKNNGRSGSVEVAELSDDLRVLIFNDIIDGNGVCLEDADAEPAEGAIVFDVENEDSEHPTHFVMFDVKFSRPSGEHNTTEDNITPDTVSMDYRAIPIELPWGADDTKNFVGGHLDYAATPAAIATAYAAWHTAIQLPAKPSA